MHLHDFPHEGLEFDDVEKQLTNLPNLHDHGVLVLVVVLVLLEVEFPGAVNHPVIHCCSLTLKIGELFQLLQDRLEQRKIINDVGDCFLSLHN